MAGERYRQFIFSVTVYKYDNKEGKQVEELASVVWDPSFPVSTTESSAFGKANDHGLSLVKDVKLPRGFSFDVSVRLISTDPLIR